MSNLALCVCVLYLQQPRTQLTPYKSCSSALPLWRPAGQIAPAGPCVDFWKVPDLSLSLFLSVFLSYLSFTVLCLLHMCWLLENDWLVVVFRACFLFMDNASFYLMLLKISTRYLLWENKIIFSEEKLFYAINAFL